MTIEAFEDARKAIRDAEAAGRSTLEIEKVNDLLNLVEAEANKSEAGFSPTEAADEAYKAQLAKWVGDNQHNNETSLESYRQVLAVAQSTIKSAVLINGGAAVTLLAFIGHLSTSEFSKFTILPFADALRLFVLGVLSASIATGCMYFTLLFYESEKTWHPRVGTAFHLVTIGLVAFALILFALGANQAYAGF
jgi:hypothetical protein